jgi:membrane associated rhomboid family serine protease
VMPAAEGSRGVLIPIGHEETTVRRWPWVSFAIIGVCLLALILTNLSPSADPARLNQRFERAMKYFLEHPYLELHPDMKKRLYEGVREDEAEALHEVVKQFGGTPPADSLERAAQQKELDRLFHEAYEAMGAHPFYRWGLVPAHIKPQTLITHMFMHAGWLHLLGNMFIFYLCGPFLEDVWGRPLFITFYLAAGVVAALAFVAHYPHSSSPLVGASGAVAGCMGAFLVRYWNTHIRFIYWFGFVFRGTFSAPAWVMLPLWLAREFLFANAMDVGGAPGGGHVAHWAHVWGFVFGLGVAGAISFFKVEQRFLKPALDNKVTLAANPEVDRAHEFSDQGNKDKAFEIMSGVVRDDPANVDAVLSLWGFAREVGRCDEVAPAMMGIIRDEARSGEMELAVSHWLEVARGAPAVTRDLGIGTRAM